MKFYAGIDLHTRKSVVCVIDQKERKLVDGLQEAGYKVKLAHTMGPYMITGAKVKTDRKDALTPLFLFC